MGIRQTLRIGIAQIDSQTCDVQGNLAKHLEFIARAREAKVDLLVFPELSLTGYPSNADEINTLSRTSTDAELMAIRGAAADIKVVVGFVEEGPGAQFFNSSLAVCNGEIIHRHRKITLPSYGSLNEGALFAAGRHVNSFEVNGRWRSSMLICADAWNPVVVALSALQHTTLLLVTVNSAHGTVSNEFSNPEGWLSTVKFYAMMYGMTVVMANRVGEEDGRSFWGGSTIINPFGNVVASAKEDDETLLTTVVDYDDVRRARLQLPTVRDSNIALLRREIIRLDSLQVANSLD